MMDHNVSHEEVSDWLNKFLGMLSAEQMRQKSPIIGHGKSENVNKRTFIQLIFSSLFRSIWEISKVTLTWH